jgi:cell division protein FtsW (lipid II flippase)
MENLIIEHKAQAISRKVIGGFWILLAIVFLILERESLSSRDWLRAIVAFVMGVIFFTPLIGSSKSQIEICEGCLKIIWMNWIRPVTIQETEIEKIILAKDGIKIYRKDKKAVKILLFYMGKEQKNKVYKFFNEYAKLKSLV